MSSRYEELDSLRGLAALSVFFGHMYLIFNEHLLSKLLFEYGPLRIMVAGSEAVILFFVLSGFVLSLPFYSNRKINYGAYVIKRVCRIYIPYIVVLIVAFISREMFYFGRIESLSNWFNVNWAQPLDANSIIDHLLLVGTFNSNLNNVVWSLVHEMRISLVFPFIMFILVRMGLKKSIGLGIVLSSFSVVYSFVTKAPFFGTELYSTIHYSSIFIIGALIAKYREGINKSALNLNIKGKIILFLVGMTLYLYAHPSFLLDMIIHDFDPFYRMVIDSWFTALGAGILIVFALSSIHFSRLLRNKFINYIGKMSYSLYLSHIAVLLSCVHLLNGSMSMWIICLIVIMVTFVVSILMYHLIEKPAMNLGKFFTKPIVSNSKDQKELDNSVKIS